MCHRVAVPPRRSPWITLRDPGRHWADRFEAIARARTENGRPPVTSADVIRSIWREVFEAAAALCAVEGHTPGSTGTCTRCGTTDAGLIRMTPAFRDAPPEHVPAPPVIHHSRLDGTDPEALLQACRKDGVIAIARQLNVAHTALCHYLYRAGYAPEDLDPGGTDA